MRLIALQKSKIERRRKSRKSRFLADSTTAILRSAHTKLRGRFCVRRCGSSYRRVRKASAVLKNFGRHPKKTFSTLSASKRTSARERDRVGGPLSAFRSAGYL